MQCLLVIAAVAFASAAVAQNPSVPADVGTRNVRRPSQTLDIPKDAVASCGYTPRLNYEMNRRANEPAYSSPAARQAQPAAATASFTSQGSFPIAKIVTCGRFRLYYEDALQSPAGFYDAISGAARRNTLCAVLTYVQNTLNINVNGTTDFIDLYIQQSWTSPNNPAPSTVTYLAAAGPYFNPSSGYGTSPGYYAGNALLHATTGGDPQPGQYDGFIIANFDTYNYWDDYQNTTVNCRYDLYSILLHEVTHILGFISSVMEDPNHYAICGVPNNGFTRFDQAFLYSGNACTPSALQKVVIGTSPAINTGLGQNALRQNAIWLRKVPIEQNHPVYSGTLDPVYTLVVGSLCSHLASTMLSFTAMSQYAPGFQSNYVMGPSIGLGQRKREWTLGELRAFMTVGPYGLNAAFAAATTLNGVDPNGWLLTSNTPAHRTNCSQPMLSYNNPYNFMELLPADFPPLTNNNTPGNPTATQLTINVASLANIADAESNPVRVYPNSLFGIRGVSSGGNNHGTLSVTPATIVYTPTPGFHGRAQFGFFLWDGHERGALRIVTIDVTPGSYTVPTGNQLVINADYEDGSEIRQLTLNPNFAYVQQDDWAYEGVFAGQTLSGAHPFNFLTHWWNVLGGDIVQDAWYACSMGSNPQHGYFNHGTMSWPTNLRPNATTSTPNNQRYHPFQGSYNYSMLINRVQGCNTYNFECDLNFERTGHSIGQIFTFQLQFVNNPTPNLHSQLYYTVPVNVKITTVAPNSWQHLTFMFQYCGTPTYYMNLLVQGVLASPPLVVSGTGGSSLTQTFTPAQYSLVNMPFIDNVSLKQVPTPLLNFTVTANPPSTVCSNPVTLTAIPWPYIPCNMTYTWAPINVTGNPVTVGPGVTTTYVVSGVSTTCHIARKGQVTVIALPSGDPPSCRIEPQKTPPPSGSPATERR